MQDLSTRTNSNKSNNLIRFTDLEANEGYNESDPANGGVTYTMGMTSFHAVKSNGEILHGVPVFVEAYDIVDQGWIWEVTKWPIVGTLASWGYDMFAKIRTQLTRGSSVESLIEDHYTRRNEIMMKNDDGVEEVCESCQNKIASEKNEGR
jgi:predicted DCC family thiol-disulfide oxidoreductase YuxK